ncbi:hypothetical protein [Nonomuraea dietziae]|uniref:hypothetical protein n=1 Tax=Nonomuraea dietziae TaxID=65515 RepID=UPI00343A835C
MMALGMAVGHLGGWFLWAAVLALLTAGWLCGSPIRRAETGHHIQDFVFMPILMMLTASGGRNGGRHDFHGGTGAVTRRQSAPWS